MLGFAIHDAPYDVVLVHGAGGNNLLWRRTMQCLSGGSNAFAVNLPGHPDGEITCRSVDDYVESLHGFIAESGLERPAVCGHSMGGAIAIAHAIAHPDDLGGLVLVSTAAKLEVNQKILDGLKARPMDTIERVITPWSFHAIDLGLGREARTALSISNLPVFLNDYLACAGFDARSRLSKISARTLVICGDKDRMTPPSWSRYLSANIPGSELRFVEGAGHMLPLEKPVALGQILQAFLSTLSR